VSQLKIFIITGLSGSGKSTVLAAFEDAGFFCVDNLPVALLTKFLDLPLQSNAPIMGLAFVMDLREKGFIRQHPEVFDTLRSRGFSFQVLFLEAGESVILQRYSQTRRLHPMGKGKSLLEGIRAEKAALEDLKQIADRTIDTSLCNVHELKSLVFSIVQKHVRLAPLQVGVLSFGFKYGVPREADLIVDVRFLKNPYFLPELKPLDGEHEAVRGFVLETPEARIFLQKYIDLLDFLIPLYEKEGKAYLTVAVGCTGGRHRSVAIARALFTHLDEMGRQAEIRHRDVDK
jgi:UPF0042 nucleotide-binding protein